VEVFTQAFYAKPAEGWNVKPSFKPRPRRILRPRAIPADQGNLSHAYKRQHPFKTSRSPKAPGCFIFHRIQTLTLNLNLEVAPNAQRLLHQAAPLLGCCCSMLVWMLDVNRPPHPLDPPSSATLLFPKHRHVTRPASLYVPRPSLQGADLESREIAGAFEAVAPGPLQHLFSHRSPSPAQSPSMRAISHERGIGQHCRRPPTLSKSTSLGLATLGPVRLPFITNEYSWSCAGAQARRRTRPIDGPKRGGLAAGFAPRYRQPFRGRNASFATFPG